MEKNTLIGNFLKLIRPHHYVKNLFVFLPLLFAGKITEAAMLIDAGWAFLSFCLISSSVYIFNDIMDREEDRVHPENRTRPIAAGLIRVSHGYILDLLFTLGALIIAYLNGIELLLVILGYKLLNILYSLILKRIPIFDVMILALGFVLRLYAGSVSTEVPLTEWIIIMTFLLSMLIGLGKRRNDVLFMEQEGIALRLSVKHYNSGYLNYGMVILSSVIIVAYIMYTLDPVTVRRFGDNDLFITAFWVVAGILRYLQLLFVEKRTENPVMLFIRDLPLKIIVLAWILNFLFFIYIS